MKAVKIAVATVAEAAAAAKPAEDTGLTDTTGVSKLLNTKDHNAYMSGYPDGSFKPAANITRAEFIALSIRFGSQISGGRNKFTDVKDSHWAINDINSAVIYGWISGYNDGTFKPGGLLNRAEAVTIVNRMLQRSPDKEAIDSLSTLKRFNDIPLSHWACYEIAEATNKHDYERIDGTEVWGK